MYGIFFGGYSYSVKMHLYERVKTRNFDKAWGFLQASMAVPTFIGIGATGTVLLQFSPAFPLLQESYYPIIFISRGILTKGDGYRIKL